MKMKNNQNEVKHGSVTSPGVFLNGDNHKGGMGMPKYDFAGWVTKNDILCSDGVIIRHGAFKNDDGRQVPLVWNHNSSVPDNVLGHVILENRDEGVYGRGYFNDTETGMSAKQLVSHGDIDSMSIKAGVDKKGNDVVNGSISEVSLVLKGANPGARIEHVLSHSGEESEDEVIIYTENIIHSADSVIDDPKEDIGEVNEYENGGINLDYEIEHADETIGDIIATLSEEQLEAVELMLGAVTQSLLDNENEEIEQGEDEMTKYNAFEQGYAHEDQITHADLQGAYQAAINNKTTLRTELEHVFKDYGITNLEVLFPEATAVTRTPEFYKDTATGYKQILAATSKSPFQKVKMHIADLTETSARARGYITGEQKFDQVFEIFARETGPQTIYKRQRLDRDDIIDVEGLDLAAWVQTEMRDQLEEEIARAILVGDGRNTYDPDKIRENNIRPIIADDDLFTIKKEITSDQTFFEDVIKAMVEYKGSGSPTMYIDPMILGRLKLLKGTDGRYLGYKPMTTAEMADLMGVKEIFPTTLMLGKGALVVNLNDYRVGAAKGGEVTSFDDFDIDFNQYIYLIETRLSGSLIKPFSAIHFAEPNSTSPETTTPSLKPHFDRMQKVTIDVDPEAVDVKQGETFQFNAAVTGTSKDPVVWSANSKDVIIDRNTGLLSVKPTATPGAKVTVTARKGSKTAEAEVTITVAE